MMNLQKFFTDNKEIVGFVLVVILVVGAVYLYQKYYNKEYMENVEEIMDEEDQMPLVVDEEDQEDQEDQDQDDVLPFDINNLGGNFDDENGRNCGEEDGEEEMSPEDLLPKNKNVEEFEKQFPTGSGSLSSKNFLVAGYNSGINTVSSSLRNANLQLRSDPYIEPKQISPFLQSTILPDQNRKSFDIGS